MLTYEFKKMKFANQVLKGIGQIMFQENVLTGILFLIGLFIAGWQLGLACLLASISATVFARLCNYADDEINAGLYGFSPALVGVGLLFFFKSGFLIWILVVIGSVLAAWIQHFFIVRKIPAYTFPFILMAWIFIFSLKNFTSVLPSEFITAEMELIGNQIVFSGFRSFGQVLFQAGLISGLLFFIGVFIQSPPAAIYAFLASGFAALLSYILGQEPNTILMGLFGFNAVLTAIALNDQTLKALLWVIVGVLITVLLDNFFVYTDILAPLGGKLTFPFVAGTWISLLLKKISVKNSR